MVAALTANLSACRWAFLGQVPYQQAWDLQRSLAQARADDRIGDNLLLLEHPPVYTMGRRSKETDLLSTRSFLEALGAEVVEVDRGGEITFHGPGQLVGYPIVDIHRCGGPLRYVRALEEILIKALAAFDISAGRVDGLTGVWVGDAKVAAIGVKVSRGVTTHGFAINVNTDLEWFRHIIPCGIHDRDVTSMERILGNTVPITEVVPIVADRFGEILGFDMREADAVTLTGIATS